MKEIGLSDRPGTFLLNETQVIYMKHKLSK